MRGKRSSRPPEGGEPSGGTAGRRRTAAERAKACELFRASGQTQQAFAKNYGISANTLAAWLARYEEGGASGLSRISDGPAKRRGRAPLAAAKKAAIVEVSSTFPTFGLRKVRDFLARFRGLKVSTGSVRKTLRTAGVSTPSAPARAKRKPAPPRRFERARPNELWQSDITYLHVPWSRRPLYLVAFLDDASRYVVSTGLHLQQRQEIAIEALLLGISRFGRPKEVLTDQGRQYFAWRGKNDFQKLLHREGIQHVLARAHHPETVGKCERFWETLKRELWDRVQPKDLEEARARLEHFVRHYNHFRPHQGLGGVTPADRFFGAESAVRRAIESAITKNEILLALGEAPRKPVFLVGQIGDEAVSLHGERGRVVIQTGGGPVREISMDELGVKGSNPREESHERGQRSVGDEHGAGGAATASSRTETNEVPGAREDAAPGAGALASGDAGGAREGAQDGGGGDRGVARQGDAGGGRGEALDHAASVLAALPAGGGGDGGRASKAAADRTREAQGPGPGAGGGPEGAAPSDQGARGRTVGGEVLDLDPSGHAGASGGGGTEGGSGACSTSRRDESGDAGRRRT
jgi:transposase InsO family protein